MHVPGGGVCGDLRRRAGGHGRGTVRALIPLGVLVEVILLRSGSCLGGTGSVVISSGIHILVRILVIDVGERVRRAHSRLLLAQLFCQLIVVGIGGQVLELSGNFLLFCFLTSAAHLTPCDYCAVRFINNREYH